jgi:hypothetical protein
VLLEAGDVAVADGFDGTIATVADSTGGTALGIDTRGERVTWRRGNQVYVTDVASSATRAAATVADGATIEGVGSVAARLLVSVRPPSPQPAAYSVVDLDTGTTTPLPEGATSVVLAGHGSYVAYIGDDPDLPEGQAGVFRRSLSAGGGVTRLATTTKGGGEWISAVSADGEVLVLAGVHALRVVSPWGPDVAVDTAPGGTPLTDQRAVAVTMFDHAGVTFSGHAEDERTQVYRWDWSSSTTTLVSTGPDGGPLAVGVGGVVANEDGTTVVFQTYDGPGIDVFGNSDGARLHVRDTRGGPGRVLCCDSDPGTSRRFPSVFVGCSGDQVAFTTSTSTEGPSAHRWDRPVPPPVVSVAGAHVAEDAGTPMTWTVSLDHRSNQPVTVSWWTFQDTSAPSDRRAAPDKDFKPAAGTITFAPGETTKTVSSRVFDDSFFERDEWFVVELFGPTGATLGQAKATGTINDDESARLWALFR